MTNEKMMRSDEREIVNRVVVNSMKAIELINRIHNDCEKLMDYGWDISTWDISQAAMLIGKEALGVAHSIGIDDGWAKEETV